MTSRSPLKGNITKPHLAWTYPARGRQWDIEILPSSGIGELELNASAESPALAPRKIETAMPVLLDLDGTGSPRPAQETYHERWARLLPDLKGWQRVAWSHTWTDQKVCRLQLYAYDQGLDHPRLVWQSDPPEETIFQPLNLVYDIDRDGIPEVCVAAHYRLMIFEGTTGRKETELRYHQSRPYGWFGVADVDHDGQVEFITIGDFQSHIDVLNYDREKPESERLSVRWRRDIEQNIEERKKWPQVGPHPIVDIDGDGRMELVLNLYNDSGDGQWHTVVLNAATGEVLHDFSRRFVQGTARVLEPNRENLFLIRTDGVLVPSFGMIELMGFSANKPVRLWSRSNAAWAAKDLDHMDASWSSTASQGMRQVIIGKENQSTGAFFFVLQRGPQRESDSSITLEAIRGRPGQKFQSVWKVRGLNRALEFTGVDGARLGVRMSSAGHRTRKLQASKAQLAVVASRAIQGPLAPPIAARLRPKGPSAVVLEGPAQEVLAIQPPRDGADPHLLWVRPGRGMGDGSRWLGLLAADLDRDGGKEIVAADQDFTGRAVLRAYRHDGSRLWEHLFEQTPGGLPVWNSGALTFWWPGNFRSKTQTDLFVNTRRGLMHSDVGQLLEGRTGHVIWRQDKAIIPGQFSWAYAGMPPGVGDLDGDGLDELVSLYPVCFWIADGRDGRLKNGVELASKKVLPAWAAYGESMLLKFGASKPRILLDSPYLLAMLETNGSPLWHGLGRVDYPAGKPEDQAGEATGVKHALIDLDGNGTFEVASAGYRDGVRVMDAVDGRILWRLAAPVPTCSRVCAADLDGRPGDELLYVSGHTIVAVTGNRSQGRILWTWDAPADLSMPVIADLDGDGLAEIIAVGADGSVYCLNGDVQAGESAGEYGGIGRPNRERRSAGL